MLPQGEEQNKNNKSMTEGTTTNQEQQIANTLGFLMNYEKISKETY